MRILLFLILFLITKLSYSLPAGFVYLKKIDPSIDEDIRYATSYNFIGRPIHGYYASECILTLQAAVALEKVEQALHQENLSLRIYDCYRPQIAVNDFIAWSMTGQHQMKDEYYPRINKQDLFRLGYIAERSGHSRGSTVDLTIEPLTSSSVHGVYPTKNQLACYAPYHERYDDGSLDMGTNFDCMDILSHGDAFVSANAIKNRYILKKLMEKYGFESYSKEWWHFTLKNEPYPNSYFNFPVTKEH